MNLLQILIASCILASLFMVPNVSAINDEDEKLIQHATDTGTNKNITLTYKHRQSLEKALMEVNKEGQENNLTRDQITKKKLKVMEDYFIKEELFNKMANYGPKFGAEDKLKKEIINDIGQDVFDDVYADVRKNGYKKLKKVGKFLKNKLNGKKTTPTAACTFARGYPIDIYHSPGSNVIDEAACKAQCPSDTWKGATYHERNSKCYCLYNTQNNNTGITNDSESAYKTCYYPARKQ